MKRVGKCREQGKKFVRREGCVRSRDPELSAGRAVKIQNDKRKLDREKVASEETKVERKNVRMKKTSRQTTGNRKRCQDSKMTSASQIKRQWHHQTRMSRERNVKENYFREMTRSTAVTTRRSGGFPIVSPFSLQPSPLSKLPSPCLPGLYQ